MSKTSKIIITVAVSFVVVIAAAMVLATILIDPNDYKDEISKIVREKTGRELVFDGDLKLSVFPWIGISTGGVSLSNAPGFAEKNMLSLKSADVSVKLIPLITGVIELRNVEANDLHVNLMRNKKGVTNWDDLTGGGNAAKQDKKTSETTEKGKSELKLSVGGVSVQNAQIVWDDRKENIRQAVNDCDITVDGFAPGSPFKFNVHVALSSSKPEIEADINTSGEANVSKNLKEIGVKGLSVVVDASGKAVPGGKGKVVLSGDAAVDMVKGAADIRGLVLEAYGMKADGTFKAAGLNGKDLNFSGDLNVPSFNLKSTLDQMAINIKTADSSALSSVGMNFNFSGTKSSVKIKDLLINLDESTIKGLFSFAGPERPDIVAQVDIDKLNIDKYLPPKEDKKVENKEAATAPAANEEKQELLPVDLLRKLTLKADLNIKQLIAGKANLSDVVVRARAKDGVLTVKPASLNAAKGAFTSTAVVDVRGKQPVMTASASLTGLDGAALSHEMTGEDSFSGKMSFNTNLQTAGNDMKSVYANLDGNFGFKVLDGYVSGFDLIYLAGDAFSVLTGGVFGSRDSKKTEFGEVSATATIKKGVAVNKDLLMKSPLLRASGEGSMNLNTMTLDYGLDAKIVGTLEGQGGKSMNDLIGLTVPVTISGAVADPSIMVDLPRFAIILAKSGFSIVGSVVEGVGDVIQGLGDTLSGRKSSGSTNDKEKNPVQKLGNTLKKFF